MFDLRPEQPWGETGKGVFSIHDAGRLGMHMGKMTLGPLYSHTQSSQLQMDSGFRDARQP